MEQPCTGTGLQIRMGHSQPDSSMVVIFGCALCLEIHFSACYDVIFSELACLGHAGGGVEDVGKAMNPSSVVHTSLELHSTILLLLQRLGVDAAVIKA